MTSDTSPSEYEQLQATLNNLTEQLNNDANLLDNLQSEEELLLEKLRELRLQKREALTRKQSASSKKLLLDSKLERIAKIHETLPVIFEPATVEVVTAATVQEDDATNYIANKVAKVLQAAPFYDKMLPFQREDVIIMGAQYLRGAKGILNANDMGLGKTFESAAAEYVLGELFKEKHGRYPRVLWLTKKSLVKSSTREFAKWRPDRRIMPIMDLQKDQRAMLLNFALTGDYLVVTNYDALTGTPELQTTDWDIVVVDEVHKLKGGANSRPTKIFEEAKKIGHNSDFILMLSGSPLQNHPKEMWCYLHVLEPSRFPSVNHFERTYCAWFGSGLQVAFDDVIGILRDQVIRRRATEVLLQLPAITRQTIEVELYPRQREMYDTMRDQLFVWLDEQEDKALTTSAIIAQLTRMRQIALYPDALGASSPVGSIKVDEAMDMIEQLDEKDQIVIFSAQFNGPLYEIRDRCNKILDIPAAIIDGSTRDVGDLEYKFQHGEIRVLLINSRSGSEGLNLQKSENWPGGASKVLFLDLWWNPEINRQCEARVYRQGQTHPVNVYILHAEDTVDNFMRTLNEEKAKVTAGIMDSETLMDKSNWKAFLKGEL